jgi:hypothetical protein
VRLHHARNGWHRSFAEGVPRGVLLLGCVVSLAATLVMSVVVLTSVVAATAKRQRYAKAAGPGIGSDSTRSKQSA